MCKKMLNPLKFKLFALRHLPSVSFWKIKILNIDAAECSVSLPFIRQTKNPFNSIYFASMIGAGELSTGALCMVHLADRGKWSMLVTEVGAEFYVKSSETITFTCNQGAELSNLLDSIQSGTKAGNITLVSEGRNGKGKLIVKVKIKWSFKQKG